MLTHHGDVEDAIKRQHDVVARQDPKPRERTIWANHIASVVLIYATGGRFCHPRAVWSAERGDLHDILTLRNIEFRPPCFCHECQALAESMRTAGLAGC